MRPATNGAYPLGSPNSVSPERCCPSREADGIGRRVCLSTVGAIGWDDLGHGHLGWSEKAVVRSYAGAEMDDEGMALKI